VAATADPSAQPRRLTTGAALLARGATDRAPEAVEFLMTFTRDDLREQRRPRALITCCSSLISSSADDPMASHRSCVWETVPISSTLD
jgi:hypothetical protein